MQLLFVVLFGAVVSFILYLSYHTHIVESKEKRDNKLIKKKDVIETEVVSKEETTEKVLEENIVNDVSREVLKFKAKRNNKKDDIEDEEII